MTSSARVGSAPHDTRMELISACTISVPLADPVSPSTRRVTTRDYTLVKVRSDDGVEAIGFCYGGSTGCPIVTAAVRELLAPVVMGRGPYLVEGLWREMYQESLLHGRVGSVMCAISAIDIALWDRNARAANLPL